MRSLRLNVFISLLMWLLIAAAAWPIFVAINFAIGWILGEGSVIDLWNQEPKRKLIADFIEGYKTSAPIAATVGLVAVIDYLLLTRNKLSGYFAGIFVILFCVALAFVYYAQAMQVLPGFALTGVALWVLYKFIDIGFRLRRVG